MQSKFLLLFFFLPFGYLVGQESFLQQKISLKKDKLSINESFKIIDKQTNDISLFLLDRKNIYVYLYNENFELKNSIKSKRPKKSQQKLLGHSISDKNEYTLFYTNLLKDKFSFIKFSFNSNQSSIGSINLSLENKVLLGSFTYDRKLYLITLTKKSSVLNFHVFDENGNRSDKIVDVSSITFLDKKNQPTNLHKITKSCPRISGDCNFRIIETGQRNTIDKTTYLNKIYPQDNKLIFSIDVNPNFTQLLTINLDTLYHSFSKFKKPLADYDFDANNSNSFLFSNKLFTASTTSGQFIFQVINTETSGILKEFKFDSSNEIRFKNSPIIQEGGAYTEYRELDDAKQFLRKISRWNIGLSVCQIDDKLRVTIGGCLYAKGGGLGISGNNSISGAPIVVFLPQPAGSFSALKSSYFHSFLDTQFEHIDEIIKPDAYEKLQKFKKTANYLKADIFFKFKDYFVYGHYIKVINQYIFRRFDN